MARQIGRFYVFVVASVLLAACTAAVPPADVPTVLADALSHVL